jgi:hypothetical protein
MAAALLMRQRRKWRRHDYSPGEKRNNYRSGKRVSRQGHVTLNAVDDNNHDASIFTDPLTRAVIISFFSWRKSEPDDNPEQDNGWWGDSLHFLRCRISSAAAIAVLFMRMPVVGHSHC